MKYLINLPLFGAALTGGWFFYLAFLPEPPSGWSDGPSRGAMAFAIFQAAALCWLMLAIAILGGVAAGAFDWLPARGRWGSLAIVLAALLGLILVSFIPVGIAASASGAVSGAGDEFGLGLWPSRLVATLLPLVLIAYLAWLINAPEEIRDAHVFRFSGLGAVGALAVLGGGVAVAALAESRAESHRDAEMRHRADEAKTDELRRAPSPF